ncbi:MAG: peptide ABC transporter permease [Carnobacterium sp.]|nr:peptide ABC transporter permease [Carnobacterium sp.]
MSEQKRNKKILWILCSILFSFLLLSFLYEPVLSDLFTIRVNKAVIDGQLAYPPFSPLEVRPFGTDILGFTIFAKIIQGFKYTFLIGLFLSVFQILISLLLSSLTIYKPVKAVLMPMISYFDKLFTLVPKPFLLLLVIGPYYQAMLFNAEDVQPAVNLIFLFIQLLVLFLVGLPSLVKLYHNELAYLLRQDFADASQNLGRSNFGLIRYSFRPQLLILTSNLLIKVLIQNLSLFIYLAYFNLYLGGSLVMKIDVGIHYTVTLSNEWSGLIGQSINRLASTPWTVLIPLIFYSGLILLLNAIKRALVGGMKNQRLY